jgi:hypothetical protein
VLLVLPSANVSDPVRLIDIRQRLQIEIQTKH